MRESLLLKCIFSVLVGLVWVAPSNAGYWQCQGEADYLMKDATNGGCKNCSMLSYSFNSASISISDIMGKAPAIYIDYAWETPYNWIEGEAPAEPAAQRSGEALLDKLNSFFKTLTQGALQPADTSKTLDSLKIEAADVFTDLEITEEFYDRYVRVLQIIRLVMAPPPDDPEAPKSEEEIGRFVKDILGEEWDAEAPPSEKIEKFSEAVATETAALRLIAGAPSALEEEPGVEPLRVGEEIKSPKLIRHVEPVYPEAAHQARVEGIVILEAVIDVQGNVKDVKILRSIPLLDQAAIDAVKQWKYEPTIFDGEPRELIMTVTVRFSLK
jgi:TonB family protein